MKLVTDASSSSDLYRQSPFQPLGAPKSQASGVVHSNVQVGNDRVIDTDVRARSPHLGFRALGPVT